MATKPRFGDISQGDNMKMTEGHQRANALFARLEAHGVVLSNSHYSVFRLFEAVAKEIDQALSDGSEQDAIAAVVGNGHHTAIDDAFDELKRRGLVEEVPPTADPVGVDLPDFPQPEAVATHYADTTTPDFKASVAERAAAVAEEPKKKRGRPKLTAAQKKARKQAKKAKAAAVAESATTETEAPAGEAAS